MGTTAFPNSVNSPLSPLGQKWKAQALRISNPQPDQSTVVNEEIAMTIMTIEKI